MSRTTWRKSCVPDSKVKISHSMSTFISTYQNIPQYTRYRVYISGQHFRQAHIDHLQPGIHKDTATLTDQLTAMLKTDEHNSSPALSDTVVDSTSATMTTEPTKINLFDNTKLDWSSDYCSYSIATSKRRGCSIWNIMMQYCCYIVLSYTCVEVIDN